MQKNRAFLCFAYPFLYIEQAKLYIRYTKLYFG